VTKDAWECSRRTVGGASTASFGVQFASWEYRAGIVAFHDLIVPMVRKIIIN